MTEVRPPIPAGLAHRPTIGGLVVPWVNVPLADGGVDFRTTHHSKWTRAPARRRRAHERPRRVARCGADAHEWWAVLADDWALAVSPEGELLGGVPSGERRRRLVSAPGAEQP